MGSHGPTKRNAKLTRQNVISFTLFKLVYCLARESLKCYSLVQKNCKVFQKETSHCQNSFALGPQEPKHYIFGDDVFLLFYARKHLISSFYLEWTECTRNCEFFPFVGPQWPELNWSKFTISCKFGTFQAK